MSVEEKVKEIIIDQLGVDEKQVTTTAHFFIKVTNKFIEFLLKEHIAVAQLVMEARIQVLNHHCITIH